MRTTEGFTPSSTRRTPPNTRTPTTPRTRLFAKLVGTVQRLHFEDRFGRGRRARAFIGQTVRYLLGPLEGRVLDITYSDTTGNYGTPPTWVAGVLIEQLKIAA